MPASAQTEEFQKNLEFGPEFDLTASDWELVYELIEDVEDLERQESFVQTLTYWWHAVRAFRKVEFNRLRKNDPRPIDLQFHRLCLAASITLGEHLLLCLNAIKGTEFEEKISVSRDDIEAMVAALRINWQEWHSEVSESRVDSLKELIFPDGETKAD